MIENKSGGLSSPALQKDGDLTAGADKASTTSIETDFSYLVFLLANKEVL